MIKEKTDLRKEVEHLKIEEKHRHEHLEFMSRMFSHNLRSPVSGLKMLFRLLDMVKGDEREDVIKNIEEGSEVLFGMIDDLAAVFLDYRHLVREPEMINFTELLNGVKSDLDETLAESGAKITAEFECESINYHLEHLRVIFTELIVNSIKFCPKDRSPRIEVRNYVENDRLMIHIGDNACGIDMANQGKDIFKMYKPLARDQEVIGKGIGLFRVKNIVEISGGKINVESSVGQGTSFKIELCSL